jgi:hypothetical protein
MVKSSMFASHLTSPSNRPRRLYPLHSNHCHPERSEGSAFLSLVAPRRSPLALAPLTPFLATLAAASQLTENPATLSPFAAALRRRVKPNPFVCHSYKKHPGVGVSRHIFPQSCSSIFSVNSALAVPGVCPDRVEALESQFKTTAVPPLQQKPLPHALFSLFPKNDDKLNPSFSGSSALFQKDCSRNSFPIISFRTLSQNARGHISQIRISSFHFRISPLPPHHGSPATEHGSRLFRTHGTNSLLARLHRCGGKFHA